MGAWPGPLIPADDTSATAAWRNGMRRGRGCGGLRAERGRVLQRFAPLPLVQQGPGQRNDPAYRSRSSIVIRA
jgi:hypothetical protein